MVRGWLHALREWWQESDQDCQRRRRERRRRELARAERSEPNGDLQKLLEQIAEREQLEQFQKDMQRNKHLF